MNHEIEIQNEHPFPIDEARLRQASLTVLNRLSDHETALTIVIEDDEAVYDLNLQYRGVDAPTDVLSFPAAPLPIEIPDELPYLGDLIIAYPYASAQAQAEGHPLMDSLVLLAVHGTLHLLGYDHDTPERRAEMWREQEAVLVALGISPSLVPALEQLPGHDDE